MNSTEVVRAKVEEVLENSSVRPAISAVDVLADEDHDGEPFLRINVRLRGNEPKLLDAITPKLGRLKSDIHRAISDMDGRYSVVRFPEDA